MLTVLDLFAGIGGISLGLERTGGFRTVAFCELDPFCRRVLAKHWPGVRCYPDIRELTGAQLAADGIRPDIVVGGFPCQDLSLAGGGAGLEGERSGLWRDFARLIGEVRPGLVLVENVSALLGRGLGDVLGDLAALGYDAEWHCIPAAALGAPHPRDRVWIVGHAGERSAGAPPLPGRPRLPLRPGSLRERAHAATAGGGWWSAEPGVGRMAYGVPGRVDRLRSLGNAVVPQVVEAIGEAILEGLDAEKPGAGPGF